MTELTLVVNGEKHRLETKAERSLLEVLREDLGLTGTKYGCGEAQCGACTVLRDGKPVRSCILPVSEVAGRAAITTIEGLEQKDGHLHPVQEAFLAEDAMQCGYCISGMIMSGMIMSGVGLLKRNPRPTEDDILRAMQGNVCRCGSYPRIVAAIKRAASVAATRAGGAA
jgi:aerobic-type carbon monoxide dehydrogenase small subunit (CoxS/CutS family)